MVPEPGCASEQTTTTTFTVAKFINKMFLVILLGIFVFVFLPLMLWGIYKCCGVKNQGTAGEPYSVAVSNHLFKDENALREDLPCQNCKLIEMGSMACYGDKCPDCGRPPPGKKAAAAAAAAASARTAGQR